MTAKVKYQASGRCGAGNQPHPGVYSHDRGAAGEGLRLCGRRKCPILTLPSWTTIMFFLPRARKKLLVGVRDDVEEDVNKRNKK